MTAIPGQVFSVTIGGNVSVMPSQVDTTGANFQGGATSESNPAAIQGTGVVPTSLTFEPTPTGAVGQSSVIGYQLVNGNIGTFTVQIVATAPVAPTHFFSVTFAGDPITITPADVGSASPFVSFSNESDPNATIITSLNPNLTVAGLTAGTFNDVTYQLQDGTNGVLRVTVIDSNIDFAAFLASSQERLLLVEIDYDGGTVYLASKPWLSDTHIPYNDWIINQPSLEASLRNFLSTGEIDAINPQNGFFADNWLSRNWHGYECRWYLGGVDWNREDFRLIVTTQVDECRIISGGNSFRFTLQDPAKRYQIRWRSTPTTYSNTAPNVINQILTEAGFQPPQYIGINFAVEGQYQLNIPVDETTEMLTVLQRAAASMGAYVRAYSGWLQIVKPDRREFGTAVPLYDLDAHDIEIGAFRTSNVQAAQNVDVVMHDGTVIPSGGGYPTTKRVDTYLSNTVQANALLSELSVYYGIEHQIISIRCRSGVFFTSVGDVLSHQYPFVNMVSTQKMGVIESVRISPLAEFATIDIAHSAFN